MHTTSPAPGFPIQDTGWQTSLTSLWPHCQIESLLTCSVRWWNYAGPSKMYGFLSLITFILDVSGALKTKSMGWYKRQIIMIWWKKKPFVYNSLLSLHKATMLTTHDVKSDVRWWDYSCLHIIKLNVLLKYQQCLNNTFLTTNIILISLDLCYGRWTGNWNVKIQDG